MKISDLYDYEKTVPEEKRISLGIVYTPEQIVSFINESTLSLWDKPHPPKFLDPCCGTGVFLLDMATKVSNRYNIPLQQVLNECAFGEDLDTDAIDIANKIMPDANFCVQDSLDSDWSGYDIIVTNPPYIRIQNLSEEVREKIVSRFSFCKGDTDIYMAFLEKMVDSNLISGLIIPNSWIKNKYADQARSSLRKGSRVNALIDFQSKKVFQNASTFTSILILGTEKCDSILVGSSLENLRLESQNEVFLDDCVLVSQEDVTYYQEVQARSHSILDVFDINVGLASLADDVFCLEVLDSGIKETTVKKRGKKHEETFKIENEMIRPCIRGGDITKNTDKKYVMIYPYDSSNKPLSADVIEADYPLTYEYLSQNKSRLLKRDKGKNKGYSWTEFGRTQALKLLDERKFVFASMIKDNMVIKDCPPGTTFLSGYCFVLKKNMDDNTAKAILTSDDMLRWVKIFGKNFGSDWIGISKQTLKQYKVDLIVTYHLTTPPKSAII